MKNNSLDDIIKCVVDISSPVSKADMYDNILLVVPGPVTAGEKTMTGVTVIKKVDELLDYGFTTEDSAYIAASVAFAQSPSPSELLVCVRNKEGEDEAVVYEAITTTLARANSEVEFYGIHITEFKDSEDVMEAIKWAEANEKLFGFEYEDINNSPVTSGEYFRSFGMYSGSADGYEADEQPEYNQYAALAWMAKCFGYDPGTETWHMKELTTITPSSLTAEQKEDLADAHINAFLRYAGSNCTIGGYTLAGEWIDVIRFRDWLKAEMQKRVFNVMKANRKVSFTDNGIGLIEGAMESTLKDGQDLGGIAPTEYDANNNPIYGYEVIVPKSTNLTEEEKKSRKLTGCYYTARLAGAIHLVEIEGYLTF